MFTSELNIAEMELEINELVKKTIRLDRITANSLYRVFPLKNKKANANQ